MAVYVDDIIITGDSIQKIQILKNHLHKLFSIKDLCVLSFFLSLEVHQHEEAIILHQHKFTRELLRDSGINTFKKAITPLPLGIKLFSDSSSPFHDPTKYRSLVGKLNFLTNYKAGFVLHGTVSKPTYATSLSISL